jgi:hypothetical protein
LSSDRFCRACGWGDSGQRFLERRRRCDRFGSCARDRRIGRDVRDRDFEALDRLCGRGGHATRGAVEIDRDLDVVGRFDEPWLGLLAELLLHVRAEAARRRAELRSGRERFDRLPHLVGGLVSLRWIERECLEDDRFERLGHICAVIARARNLSRDDRAHRQKVVVGFEQATRGRELVEDDAEREHVTAPIERSRRSALLRRHVRGFALQRSGLGDLGCARGGLCDSEVDDLHVAVVADEDVRGRDVAMDEPERFAIRPELLVCVMECGRSRADDRDDVLERQLLLVLREVREQAPQVFAVHVLHREEVLVAFLADVVDLDDVVMV